MKIKIYLEKNKDQIMIGNENSWSYSPLKCWEEDPFMELKRFFAVHPDFELVDITEEN